SSQVGPTVQRIDEHLMALLIISGIKAILTGMHRFIGANHSGDGGHCRKERLSPLETSMGWILKPKTGQCFISDRKWRSGRKQRLWKMAIFMLQHSAVRVNNSQMTQVACEMKLKSGECDSQGGFGDNSKMGQRWQVTMEKVARL